MRMYSHTCSRSHAYLLFTHSHMPYHCRYYISHQHLTPLTPPSDADRPPAAQRRITLSNPRSATGPRTVHITTSGSVPAAGLVLSDSAPFSSFISFSLPCLYLVVFLFPWCRYYPVATCCNLCGTLLPFRASCIVHPASRIASCIASHLHLLAAVQLTAHKRHNALFLCAHKATAHPALLRSADGGSAALPSRLLLLCPSYILDGRPAAVGGCNLQLAPSSATDTRSTRNTRDNTRTTAKDTWHLALTQRAGLPVIN